MAAASIAVFGVSSYWFYHLVQRYGFDGAIRYIWEGSPYPTHVRQFMDTLKDVDEALEQQERKIAMLEEALERAKLDSVDESESPHLLTLWKTYLDDDYDLRRQLAVVSESLDKLAATVDQVLPVQEDIKEPKKSLSTRAVELMERVDALIHFFRSASSDASEKSASE
jgi:hypothetical protein